MMWPPNSPDLILVDYAVWEALQQRTYCDQQFGTVEQWKQAIVNEWHVLCSLVAASTNGNDV